VGTDVPIFIFSVQSGKTLKVILRIQLFVASDTYRLPDKSTVIPQGELKFDELSNPS